MKRWIAASLALLFYASLLPWAGAADFWRYNASDINFENYGLMDNAYKLSSPYVDVRAYETGTSGIPGDGLDDWTAFIAAARVASSTKLPLKIVGDYNFNSQQAAQGLTAANGDPLHNLTVIADSPQAGRLIFDHASPQNGFRYNGTGSNIDNVRFSRVGIIGNSQYTATDPTYGQAFMFRRASNITFEDCYFENWYNLAVHIGSYTTSPSSGFIFRRNKVVNTGSLIGATGVLVGYVQGRIEASYNDFDNVSRPISVEGGSVAMGDFWAVGNRIKGGNTSSYSATNYYYGIHLLLDQSGNTMESAYIAGNHFSQNPATGANPADIFISGVSGEDVLKTLSVVNNTSYLFAGNIPFYFAHLSTGRIEGNTIYANNATASGITNHNCDNTSFSSNTFRGTFSNDIVEDSGGTPTNNLYYANILSGSGSGIVTLSTSNAKVAGPFGSLNQQVFGGPRGAFTVNDNTPSVANGNFFRTVNTDNTTKITAFDDGANGQKITVLFNDSVTTVDFTGTNLLGNGGIDWTPLSQDWMECIYDGSSWYCAVHDTTS